MSTRSTIGRKNDDGTIDSIYCHNDGYLSGVGNTLFKHYQDRAKVDELIALGDISSLGENIGEKHDFNLRSWELPADDVRKTWTRSYGRDREEKGTSASKSMTEQGFKNHASNSDAEFIYLFTNEGWMWMEEGKDVFVPLELETAA